MTVRNMECEERLKKLNYQPLNTDDYEEIWQKLKLTSGIYDSTHPYLLNFNTQAITRGHNSKLTTQTGIQSIRFNFFTRRIRECCWQKYSDFGVGKKKYDSEFLSYNLMLNSGKKIRALRDKKINILTLVLNETKNHNPPLNGRSLMS